MKNTLLLSLVVYALPSIVLAQAAITPPFGISTNADRRSQAPDVAFDPATSSYLAVWDEFFAAGPLNPLDNYRIVARRYDANGSPIGGRITLENGVLSYIRPKVCLANGRFLVVYRTGNEDLGLFGDDATARVVDTSGAVSSSIQIRGTSLDMVSHDCGGDRSGTGDIAVVAWSELGRNIAFRRVRVPASGAPSLVGPRTVVEATTSPDTHTDVGVTNTRPDAGSWMITWTTLDRSPTTPQRDVRGRWISPSGTLTPAASNVDVFSELGVDEMQASVAASPTGEFAAICQFDRPSVGIRLVSKVFMFDGPIPAVEETEDPGSGIYTPRDPSIDWVGNGYLAVWERNRILGSGDSELVAQRMESPLDQPGTVLHAYDRFLGAPAIHAGELDGRAMLVCRKSSRRRSLRAFVARF